MESRRERRIIDEACSSTLSKASERRQAEGKQEQLPALVYPVKVISLCVQGLEG